MRLQAFGANDKHASCISGLFSILQNSSVLSKSDEIFLSHPFIPEKVCTIPSTSHESAKHCLKRGIIVSSLLISPIAHIATLRLISISPDGTHFLKIRIKSTFKVVHAWLSLFEIIAKPIVGPSSKISLPVGHSETCSCASATEMSPKRAAHMVLILLKTYVVLFF